MRDYKLYLKDILEAMASISRQDGCHSTRENEQTRRHEILATADSGMLAQVDESNNLLGDALCPKQ